MTLDGSLDTLADKLVGASMGARKNPFEKFSTYPPSRLKGLPVKEEVEEVGRLLAALGVALPVNPGTLEVVVIATGRQDRHKTVPIAERERKEITVEPGAELPAPAPRAALEAHSPLPPPPVLPAGEDPWSHRHRGSLIAAAIAALSAGAGVGLGVKTWTHYADLAKTCPEPCSPDNLASLHREQAATNGLFVAAGLAALASVPIYVFESRSQAGGVTLAPQGAGARVVVQF